MVINGGMQYMGDAENFVIFTSKRDKEYGNNQEENKVIPRSGDWGYIYFNEENPQGNEYVLENTLIRYGSGRNPDSKTHADLNPMVIVVMTFI